MQLRLAYFFARFNIIYRVGGEAILHDTDVYHFLFSFKRKERLPAYRGKWVVDADKVENDLGIFSAVHGNDAKAMAGDVGHFHFVELFDGAQLQADILRHLLLRLLQNSFGDRGRVDFSYVGASNFSNLMLYFL